MVGHLGAIEAVDEEAMDSEDEDVEEGEAEGAVAEAEDSATTEKQPQS